MLHAPSVTLLGLPFTALTPADLRCRLYEQLCHGQTTAKLFTPNLTIAATAHRMPSLHELLRQGDLLLPDGHGVLVAARLAGTPLPCRLPGIEAGETVIELCAKEGWPVYFLGAAPGIAAKAASMWNERLPTRPIVGTHHGFFDERQNAAILDDIRASGARVVLVCLGFPAQERWITQNAQKLPAVRLLLGLGGSFDVWAGQVRRAPRAFQRLGLEWLWRSVQKPSRLRTLLPAFPYLWAASRSKKRQNAVKI